MVRKKISLFCRAALVLALPVLLFALFAFRPRPGADIFAYIADTKKDRLALYWKDGQGRIYGSPDALKADAERSGQVLVFAMNGGMYQEDRSPLGLYIENAQTLTRLNTRSGYGNFYLKPNGVFFLTAEGMATVCRTQDFRPHRNIRWATQSGPMLLVDGRVHPEFRKGSRNRNIRNGVGILPDGRVLFAISNTEVNLYDFALYFKEAGCKDALYLDGFVSRAYCPERGRLQTGGTFGVLIGVTRRK